ncbi:hypothetical protein AMTRI_Chr03g148300 [Amborella trichopoda]
MFSISAENLSLHTHNSAVVSYPFDSQSFSLGLVSTQNPRALHLMVYKGLNANPDLLLDVFMKMQASMPVQYKSPVECCRLVDLSVYACVKATATSLFSH